MTEWRTRLLRLIRFGTGAAISFGGTISITYLTTEWLNYPEELSFAVSIVIMFFVNFLYLRLFVFRATATKWATQMRNFFVASIGFRGAEYLAFLVLLDLFHVQYLISAASVLVLSFLIKFQIFDKHIFSTSR